MAAHASKAGRPAAPPPQNRIDHAGRVVLGSSIAALAALLAYRTLRRRSRTPS